MRWRRYRPQPAAEADTMPLLRTGPDNPTTPMPAVSHPRRITPARAALAAVAVMTITAATALALVTVPAGPALGAADALALPAAPAVPLAAVDLGSPALDKAHRAAAASAATATASVLALHKAHLAHQAHLAVLARRAAQARAAKAAAAQQLLAEQAAAKKARSVAPVTHRQPAGSPGGSTSSSSGGYTVSSAFQACVIRAESGGNPQIWNASGHWGLYQFSYSTWVAHGGAPSLFGHADGAYQTKVFWQTVHDDGTSDWAPYDGC